jgi:iron complex outermembrane recepter protein
MDRVIKYRGWIVKKARISNFKYAAAPLALGLALISTPSFAQDATAAAADEETAAEDTGAGIIVTGSRIARPNLEAPSPVTVVNAEQIELTGTTTVETLLNELPQVIPGNTRVSNNSGGENFSTIDLRGLGPGRTLVLLDGERLPASSTTGVTDIAQIPTGLISRVDVVTGGASAVYGSDAMAGVINFILKKDYQGVEFTAQNSVSQDGTGNAFNVSGMVGGNFGDGKGNMTFYGSFTNRSSVSQARYPYSAVSAAVYFPSENATGQYGIPYVVDSPSDIQNTPGWTQNVGLGGGSATPPWGWIANNGANPFQNLSIALPNTFGAGKTDTDCNTATPGAAVNGGNLSWNDAGQLSPRNAAGQCAIPLRSTGSTRYNYGPLNYLVTPADRMTLTTLGHYDFSDATRLKVYASYTNANQQVALAPTPAGASTAITVPYNSPLIPADLRAALNSRPDPTGSFILNRRFSETGPRIGDFKTDSKNIRGILEHDIDDNWKVNFIAAFGRIDNTVRNQGNIRRSAVNQGLAGCPAGSGPGCVPINLFGPNTLTPAMLSFVALATTDSQSFEQLRAATNITGSIGELPGGPIGVAIGAEYRKDTGNSFVDDAKRTGDIIVGAGARYSDYSSVGGLFNWKAEAEFTPISAVKFRASYNRAARAPNVFELFQNGDQGFPSYTDPCAASNVGRDTAFCIAQGIPAALIPGFAASNTQTQAYAFGNQTLSEEKAETWTAGAVLNFNELLGINLTATADYYNIKLTDRVAAQGAQFFIGQCYTGRLASACSRITRNPVTGQIDSVNTTVVNSDTPLTTSGIDVGLDWSTEVMGGKLYISDVLTFVEKYVLGTQDFVDTAFSGNGGVTPKWANTLTAGYTKGGTTFQARYVWKKGGKQNFPGADLDGLYPYDLATGDPLYDQYPDRIPDLKLLNISLRQRVGDNFEITGIVNNLLGYFPPQTTTGILEQANTNINFYDPYALGRTFTLQARIKF